MFAAARAPSAGSGSACRRAIIPNLLVPIHPAISKQHSDPVPSILGNLQKMLEFRGGKRFFKQIPLHLVTPLGPQEGRLIRAFHPFNDDLETEIMGHADRGGMRAESAGVGNFSHERAVNLDA